MTTPGGTAPDGAYVIGGGDYSFGQSLTEAIAKTLMTSGSVASYTTVQQNFDTEARSPIRDLNGNLYGQSVVISDHENRITILESGDQIAEINENSVWTKPAGMVKHTFIGLAGGGAGARSDSGISDSNAAGFGGGQGGYAEITYTDANVESTVTVVIGAGGAGATSDNQSGQAGGPTTFAKSTGVFFTAGGGPGGGQTTDPNTGTGTHPEWAANGGHGAGRSGSPTPEATQGGNGLLAPGGVPGVNGSGTAGGDGGDCPPGNIGPGGGGGGGGAIITGTAGNGGNGGYPSGGGGGSGNYTFAGFNGNGGNGGHGRAIIISSPHA